MVREAPAQNARSYLHRPPWRMNPMSDRGARPCPVCGSARKRPILAYARHHLAHCRDCGMVHVALEPSPQELQAYYGEYPVHADVSPITMKRYDELLDGFARWRRHGRILDVGCGAGNFLERAALRGWEVHGTEYGARALEACRAKGIRIIEGPLDPAHYPVGHFDVVCSFEVIEHVTHPAEELRRMVQVTRPGGALYITTPNYRCVGRWMAGAEWSVVNYPEHLNYFTPRTLKRLAGQQGLSTVWMKTTGIDLIRLRARQGMAQAQRDQVRGGQEHLRERMEVRPHLRLAKAVVNGTLSLLGIGDHMKAAFVRGPQ